MTSLRFALFVPSLILAASPFASLPAMPAIGNPYKPSFPSNSASVTNGYPLRLSFALLYLKLELPGTKERVDLALIKHPDNSHPRNFFIPAKGRTPCLALLYLHGLGPPCSLPSLNYFLRLSTQPASSCASSKEHLSSVLLSPMKCEVLPVPLPLLRLTSLLSSNSSYFAPPPVGPSERKKFYSFHRKQKVELKKGAEIHFIDFTAASFAIDQLWLRIERKTRQLGDINRQSKIPIVLLSFYGVVLSASFPSSSLALALSLPHALESEPSGEGLNGIRFLQRQAAITLGYYLSWALFSLSHHVMVWMAADLAGHQGQFRDYALLVEKSYSSYSQHSSCNVRIHVIEKPYIGPC
ncbi:mitovirus RNA-dependent RNA polymerase [Striga asiatica]|uniref:Mitovirus RNA-dependent RNA polymerase n=1 Tax=Striga asiatica TaxID=4170 RepID=A0A5A7Q082_STRAF|nr:mitovirus RNA-dependent RNA polymerase [Striga asiatica]